MTVGQLARALSEFRPALVDRVGDVMALVSGRGKVSRGGTRHADRHPACLAVQLGIAVRVTLTRRTLRRRTDGLAVRRSVYHPQCSSSLFILLKIAAETENKLC